MFKTEMHLHTLGNSDCAKLGGEDIARVYHAEGYAGIVCTNHFNRFIWNNYLKGATPEEKIKNFLAGYFTLARACEPYNIRVYFGLELALLGDDYHDGLGQSCAELLVYGITVEEFLKYNISLADMDYSEFFRFAEERGWLVVQAHSFRVRTKLVEPEFLHGIEVLNGHPHHDSQNAKALARAEQYGKIKTAGSDFHFEGGQGTGMIFPVEPQSEADLVSLLRAGEGRIFTNRNA